jgi:hypothetical protein
MSASPLSLQSLPSNLGPSSLLLSRYANSGEQLIIDTATKAVAKLRSLPAGQKEGFASGFDQLAAKLGVRQDEITSSRQALPAELPDTLPQPNVMYKKGRRRGNTGREAAEEEEKSKRSHAKELVRQAESCRAEDQAWSKELKQDHINRHSTAYTTINTAVKASVSTPVPIAQEVIEFISDDPDNTESSDNEDTTAQVKAEEASDAFDIGVLIDTGSPLVFSQDPSEAENDKSIDMDKDKSKDEDESNDEDSHPQLAALAGPDKRR